MTTTVQRILMDKDIDIFQAIKTIQQRRTQFVDFLTNLIIFYSTKGKGNRIRIQYPNLFMFVQDIHRCINLPYKIITILIQSIAKL